MTCIVALKHKNEKGNVAVTMGCDSMVSGHRAYSEQDVGHKIFKKKNMLIGVSGACRVSDVIEHEFEPPLNVFSQEFKEKEVERYMVANFVPSLIEFLDKKKMIEEKELTTKDRFSFSLLVTCYTRIYEVSPNFTVLEASKFTAIGSGTRYALGALFNKKDREFSNEEEAKEAIETALGAAAFFDLYVDNNFKFETLDF